MRTKSKVTSLLALLAVLNAAAWILTWTEAHRYAILISTGLLAYGFGLRHAVDADHISAIDNTTRKLMQQGRRPVGVGFFFSLGHSTVVFLLCLGLALSTAYVQRHLPEWRATGALVGTLVSGLFLYLIGVVNLIVLFDLYRLSRRVLAKENAPLTDHQMDMDKTLEQRGLLARILQPMLRLVDQSWHMYFVGFLFGLGFDTATEVGILTLSARSGQAGIPIGVSLTLPLLFAAGMCLIDSLDGILMLGAYGWAFLAPVRKLRYNLAITVLSVLIAFVVGTYEILQIVQDRLSLHGRFWTFVANLSFDNLGYVIIATFALAWGLSTLMFKYRRGDAR